MLKLLLHIDQCF